MDGEVIGHKTKPGAIAPGFVSMVQRAGTLSGVVVFAARFMWSTVAGGVISASSFPAAAVLSVGRSKVQTGHVPSSRRDLEEGKRGCSTP
ncbi:hypothetical protein [Amycolatopsis sp. RTGN1]|uniref:hypothetical protein n=1 Tax=Amycolatopsis ponsaeliensis TaxID=2992142 RepID=UPI00254FBE3B|nr:hypothetical protein [Amycolatopsis sp. RTGN1]